MHHMTIYKIVCAIKTEFLMTIGTNNNKLPNKDTISKIIYRITRRYVIRHRCIL